MLESTTKYFRMAMDKIDAAVEAVEEGRYDDVSGLLKAAKLRLVIGLNYADNCDIPCGTMYGYLPVELADRIIEKYEGGVYQD